ncbi:MAG: iron-containing redox enzyme family protein [Mycolicibacterium sp.]|uniref:iron-containing redox enzyme family protein n=1 Tax=Mycolicibacterium sp. TaxID=2320850 RepID=UPI003D0C95FF
MPTLQQPVLPDPRGPISMSVVELLSERAPNHHLTRVETSLADADPYGIDVQLTLYLCYELHYRGFADADPGWEWNPGLLHLRRRLEELFLTAVRHDIGDVDEEVSAAAELERLCVEPVEGNGPSHFLRDEGTWEQMREYFVHRSIYHLKEGDPHAWTIPRLTGQAKASFVAVEFDEFGAGKGARLHQTLFAELMAAAGLDTAYLGYLADVPAVTLAVVNLMSMFGLHRRLRGASVGHFAATEVTSPPGSRRMVQALDRLGAPAACRAFYLEHVEADAVHEQVVRTDVVGDLIVQEPHLNSDVVFGIRAFEAVEDRLADHLIGCWQNRRSSLRHPLD